MTKLISFIIPSRNLENIKDFFNNIESTASDPANIEILIKIDDDQPDFAAWLEHEKKSRPFDIKFICTPRIEGIYSIAIAVEQLFYLTDSESNFIQILSDEPRFITKHWDKILAKYIHFFSDDIFRLRLSSMKWTNYCSHYECTFHPESFAIHTRRWLELTEGTGDCWGSDAYQQCVAFHLSLGPGSYLNYYRENSLLRDVVVNDIEMTGLDFSVGLSEETKLERSLRNIKEWNRLTTHTMQEHFSYLARRILCGVIADKYKINNYTIRKSPNQKSVLLINQNGETLFEAPYGVQRIFVYSQNFTRKIWTMPRLTASYLRKRIALWRKIKSPEYNLLADSPILNEESGTTILLAARNTKRYKIRAFLRSMLFPFYRITNRIDRLLMKQRPGISPLSSKKPNVSLNVPAPSQNQIEWLKSQLHEQQTQQLKLQNKIFTTSHVNHVSYKVLGNGETFNTSS